MTWASEGEIEFSEFDPSLILVLIFLRRLGRTSNCSGLLCDSSWSFRPRIQTLAVISSREILQRRPPHGLPLTSCAPVFPSAFPSHSILSSGHYHLAVVGPRDGGEQDERGVVSPSFSVSFR